MAVSKNNVLQQLYSRLNNLSTNNKAIKHGRLTKDQDFDLQQLFYLHPKKYQKTLDKAIEGAAEILLMPRLDTRDPLNATLGTSLTRIKRRAALIIEEQGSRDLHIGWPYLRGRLSDGAPINAPLFLFPYNLKDDGLNFSLQRPAGNTEPIILNKTLLQAFAVHNNIKLTDALADFVAEDIPQNLDGFGQNLSNDPTENLNASKLLIGFRAWLLTLLRDNNIDVLADRSFFDANLVPFIPIRADDATPSGTLSLINCAVLGLFPTMDSFLAPDFLAMIDQKVTLASLFKVPASGTDFIDDNDDINGLNAFPALDTPPPINEADLITPLPIDGSQEEAIMWVKQGQSLVVQGPPGTGKSQLIANLIADFIARGKKVLVVCKKKAALDVVQQRLAQIGLDNFAANIHDYIDDRASLYRQLAAEIDQIPAYQQLLVDNSIDYNQQQHLRHAKAITDSASKLSTYKDALFDTKLLGISAKSLYLLQDKGVDIKGLDGVSKLNIPFHQLEGTLAKVTNFLDYLPRLNSASAWRLRESFVSPSNTKGTSQTTLQAALTTAEKAITAFQTMPVGYIDYKTLQPTYKTFLLASVPFFESNPLWLQLFSYLAQHPDTRNATFIESFRNKITAIGNATTVIYSGPEALRLAQKTAEGAQKLDGFLTASIYKLLSKDYKEISAIAQAEGLLATTEGFNALAQLLLQRAKIQQLLPQYKDMLSAVGLDVNALFPKALTEVADALPLVAKIVNQAESNGWLKLICSIYKFGNTHVDGAIIQTMVKSAFRLDTLYQQIAQAIDVLGASIVQVMISTSADATSAVTLFQNLTLQLDNGYNTLLAVDKLIATFNPSETKIVQLTLAKIGINTDGTYPTIDTISLISQLRQALLAGYINRIETAFPILKITDTLEMGHLQQDLLKEVGLKEEGAAKMAQMGHIKHLLSTTASTQGKSLINDTKIQKELYHEVTKKRRIMPVRRLLGTYQHAILKLIPCFMASPDTVSALFPMEEGLFDLVIFDEASQCFAQQGLPAMYRGKQIVIAGDSKQLQPNNLYQLSNLSDTEDTAEGADGYDSEIVETNIALGANSLLDLAATWLPQKMLQGHYRSAVPALINFSNTHFYNGKLQMVPAKDYLHAMAATGNKAIEVIKMEDGVWHKNTNLPEANKVLALVLQLVTDQPYQTIGIVTFNQPQQVLILDLLEKTFADRNIPLPTSLFVKNIENVQGDERDVIIFSTAYAPDENGKLRLNFGTLSMPGGENRLNVAVTRAKHKIYLVTSVFPHQLTTDSSTNQGPKLLRAYLEYANKVSNSPVDLVTASNQTTPVNTLLASHQNASNSLRHRIADVNADVTTDVDFADAATLKGNLLDTLIFTDDVRYQNCQNPKDWHVYQPRMLAQKGWQYHQIWSRENKPNPE